MTHWNQKLICFALSAALLIPLTGCRPTPPPAPTAVETPPVERMAEEKGEAAVDWSHAGEGYILARRGESEKRWKLRVVKDTEYTYDLTGERWVAVPLSEGDGKYAATVFEQTEGTAYLPILVAEFDVKLADPFSPFLRPNQQVDYTTAPLTLAKAGELTEGAEEAMEKVGKIYSFVSATLSYDDEQAGSVQNGYIPALDQVLQREKGICLDFAALMTAMVRSRGIPCRLAVGDAGTAYHAWVEVWDAGTETWTRYDPTFAASGKDASGVEYVPKFYY